MGQRIYPAPALRSIDVEDGDVVHLSYTGALYILQPINGNACVLLVRLKGVEDYEETGRLELFEPDSNVVALSFRVGGAISPQTTWLLDTVSFDMLPSWVTCLSS